MSRPHKPPANEPKPIARYAFELLHIGFGHASIVVALLTILSGYSLHLFISLTRSLTHSLKLSMMIMLYLQIHYILHSL